MPKQDTSCTWFDTNGPLSVYDDAIRNSFTVKTNDFVYWAHVFKLGEVADVVICNCITLSLLGIFWWNRAFVCYFEHSLTLWNCMQKLSPCADKCWRGVTWIVNTASGRDRQGAETRPSRQCLVSTVSQRVREKPTPSHHQQLRCCWRRNYKSSSSVHRFLFFLMVQRRCR